MARTTWENPQQKSKVKFHSFTYISREALTLDRQSNISVLALNSWWMCVCHRGLKESGPGIYEDGGCHSVVWRKRHSMAHFNQRFHLGGFFLLLQHTDRDLESPGWWRSALNLLFTHLGTCNVTGTRVCVCARSLFTLYIYTGENTESVHSALN